MEEDVKKVVKDAVKEIDGLRKEVEKNILKEIKRIEELGVSVLELDAVPLVAVGSPRLTIEEIHLTVGMK